MKEHVDRLFGKLRSSKGETLAELLVSVLVIVLGLTMFATAMMSSKKMLVKGDAVMQAYYTQRNILEGEETKDERNGRLADPGTKWYRNGFGAFCRKRGRRKVQDRSVF